MKSLEFEAGVWSERLKRGLPGFLRAQGPLLKEYEHHNPREQVVVDGREAKAEYHRQRENTALAASPHPVSSYNSRRLSRPLHRGPR